MKLKEIYNSNKPVISFEIFPPKGEDADKKVEDLFIELEKLCKFNPSFISVTYGAGGSTRDRTLDLVFKIKDRLTVPPMPHFTCVGTTRKEITNYLKLVSDAKIKNILALRGDPPLGETEFQKPEDGFGYANELTEYIKTNTSLGIAVAGYPEGHKDCSSIDLDILNLKRKVDAGADVIITQLFYDNSFFFNFLEKVAKAGINIPVIPGVMPITNIAQTEKMATLCGATMPEKLVKKLAKYENDKASAKQAGIEYALTQCEELIDNKVKGLHFCTLNKADASSFILKELGY